MPEDIVKLIGQILLYGGSATVITLGVLRWLGQKWFENQFAKSLEEFRRKQMELIETYKFNINSRFNRITKIHEKEFEVLPEAWYKLQDAHILLLNITSFLQSWPDLNNYSKSQLDTFLENCELEEFQKNDLLNSEDKISYYSDKVYWIRLSKFTSKFSDFRKYLRYNKIFLSKDIYKSFSQIEYTLIEIETELENPNMTSKPWNYASGAYKKHRAKFESFLYELEDAVQKRLHFNES